MLVYLTTSYGKSLCYQTLVFILTRGNGNKYCTVVIVFLLNAFMVYTVHTA